MPKKERRVTNNYRKSCLPKTKFLDDKGCTEEDDIRCRKEHKRVRCAVVNGTKLGEADLSVVWHAEVHKLHANDVKEVLSVASMRDTGRDNRTAYPLRLFHGLF